MGSRDDDAVDAYWEAAGRAGYHSLFPNERVAAHVLGRRRHHALEVARQIGIGDGGAVLELGCGDGEFAIEVLGRRFHNVDAIDGSRAAIARALARPHPGHVHFHVSDLRTHDYAEGTRWDGAFVIGFLHHVKPWVAAIVTRLSSVAPRVVVVEPNGDNVMRRLIEQLPSCRQAGCASFRLREMVSLFQRAGYELRTHRNMGLFLARTPTPLLPVMARLERWVEAHPSLRRLCGTRVLGFTRDP